MFPFNISLTVLLSVAILLSEKKLQVEAECDSNTGIYGCGPNKYCCKRYPWRSNVCHSGGCVGQSCYLNRDCGGPGECCSSSEVCTKNKSLCHECHSNSDCGYNKYCCKQRYNWQTNVCGSGGCVGQPCYSDSYCGEPGECCNSTNYCTKSPCHECSSNFDCDSKKYCCKQRYSEQRHVCGSGGCVGQPCSSDSDCGGRGECCNSTYYCTKSGCTQCSSDLYCGYNKYCCKQMYSSETNVCGYGGCVGQPCSSDSDCGGSDECCSSTNHCTKSSCDHETKALASWLIAVIVVSVLVAVVIPIAIVVCFYRGMASASRRRTQQGQVLNQPTGSTIALQNIQTVQNNPIQLQNPSYSPLPYFDQGQDQDAPSPKPLNQPPAYTELI